MVVAKGDGREAGFQDGRQFLNHQNVKESTTSHLNATKPYPYPNHNPDTNPNTNANSYFNFGIIS